MATMMPCTRAIVAWWLLVLMVGVGSSIGGKSSVEAFAPVTTVLRVQSQPPLVLYSKGRENEEKEPPVSERGSVGRRGMLQTLLGGAVSMAAGDVLLNTAGNIVGGSGGAAFMGASGLYQRVLAFGNKYRGSAIASEDLMAFIAAQKGAMPEIKAWLAAQQKLQVLRRTAGAAGMATAAKRTRTAAKVATGGGVAAEDILATFAGAAAVKSVVSSPTNSNSTATLEGRAESITNNKENDSSSETLSQSMTSETTKSKLQDTDTS